MSEQWDGHFGACKEASLPTTRFPSGKTSRGECAETLGKEKPPVKGAASSGKIGRLRVDLCFLQLVGIIHVNRLPLCVEVNRSKSTFAVTVAGSFYPAER